MTLKVACWGFLAASILTPGLGCRDQGTPASQDPPPSRPLEPAPAPATPTDAASDGWVTLTPGKCLPDVILPAPPGWALREIRTGDDRCIAGVAPPDRTGVNVERSTRTLAEFQHSTAEMIDPSDRIVRSDTRPNGWVAATGRFAYAHRDDLNITCIGTLAEEMTVNRVCTDAKASGK